MSTIEEKVFETIKSGKVKMRPRWYFILETTLAIVAGTVLFVTIVFLAIFINFIEGQTGAGLAIGYGLAGWVLFLRALPWTLIITAAVFIILLAILAQRYAFVYQRPLIYALIGIVIFAVIGGIVLAETPLYQLIFNPSGGSRGFLIEEIDRYETGQLSSVNRGEVTLIADNGFMMQNAAGQTSTVIFVPGASFSPKDYHAGEQVVVFGTRGPDGIITAFGVQKL